jgi:hypothetical protein
MGQAGIYHRVIITAIFLAFLIGQMSKIALWREKLLVVMMSKIWCLKAVESLEFVTNAEIEETEKQMATPGSDREREAHILHGAKASAVADGDSSLKYISLSPQEVSEHAG